QHSNAREKADGSADGTACSHASNGALGSLGFLFVGKIASSLLVGGQRRDVIIPEADAAQPGDRGLRLGVGLHNSDHCFFCHSSLLRSAYSAFTSISSTTFFTPSVLRASAAIEAFSTSDCTGPRSVTTPSAVMTLMFLAATENPSWFIR